MRFGERYAEQFITRLKFIFSIEAVCVIILMWGCLKSVDKLGIEAPSRWVNYNMFVMYQIGSLCVFFTVIAAVYWVGELIRRKYKLSSILFYDTGNQEIKNIIISLMKENSNISTGKISDMLGISVVHAEEYIRKLKKSGLTIQEGRGNNLKWVVK